MNGDLRRKRTAAMYELVQVADGSYYIPSPAKIGLVQLRGNDVCVIDSGNGRETGRKARRILDTNRWRLSNYRRALR